MRVPLADSAPELPEALRWLVAGWVVVLGAVVGSFLNVVIARVPRGLSIVHPRSRCPGCEAPIAWYDNVPVVSFLLLRARCRSCGKPISWRYPLVEALVAGAAGLAYARHGFTGAALAELVFVSLLVALSFIDLDTWSLPLPLTIPLVVAGLCASFPGWTAAGALRPSAIGAAVGAGAFAIVALAGERVFRKEAMGWGDVALLGGIGAWIGWVALLPIVMFASLQGAIVGIVQLSLGRGEQGPPEPAGAPPEGTGTGSATADGAAAEGASPGDGADRPEGAASAGEDEEVWIPPRHSIPFGPFLALGALEWLYLAPVLARAIPILKPFV